MASGVYRYYAEIDHRARQWFDMDEDGSLDFGMGEQCAEGCAEGFKFSGDRRFLICENCDEHYRIVDNGD